MKRNLNSRERKLLQALLKKTRQDAGLLQSVLAERLGRPQSFVSKYESGERCLDLIELREVCQAMGISLENFIIQFEEISDEDEGCSCGY